MNQFVLSGTNNALPVDRWFCLEMMVKLNTPGRRNGEIRLWQDGAEVFHHTQLPIREADSVKTRSVHGQFRSSQTVAGIGTLCCVFVAQWREN